MVGNTVKYQCEYCGRTWEANTKAPGDKTGWTGFLAAAVRTHIKFCRHRTPEERHKVNMRDFQRWQTKPPKHTRIILDWYHPGVALPHQSKNRT